MRLKSSVDLERLLNRLGTPTVVIRSMNFPEAAKFTATQCWLRRSPEDEDTAELRRQLLFLHEHGSFDYRSDL
jgi:hypothetical protein